MDLRRQLVAWLGGILLVLIGVALAINLAALRSDVAAEVAASERLALALLAAGHVDQASGHSAAQLAALFERAGLRHVTISVDGTPAASSSSVGTRVARALGFAAGGGHALQMGSHVLRIAPNPVSEVDERLTGIVQLWSTLLFFSGATLCVAWWSADRALRPVRALEAGLLRLASGEPDARLPPFALREFARVAAAIDHLACALRSAQHGQRSLAHQLIRVQEDERSTLAMELHDEVGQTLTAISLTAAYMERHAAQLDGARIDECARELRRDVRACSGQLRAMLSRLRPHSLEGAALGGALRELVRSWQQRSASIAFSMTLPLELPLLGKDESLVLYRVVQEALTNVVRHSQASHCQVMVALEADELLVRIEDDGVGFATGAVHGCGLTGMAERVRMVGGRVQLVNRPGGGVQVQASLPVKVVKELTW